MELNSAIRDRIFAAATSLYEQNGGKTFPTVGDVRHLARCNMNDAAAGMKEWRRQQTAQAAPIAIIVPEVIQRNAQQTAATLWAQAQELANESLRSAQAGWDVERAEAEELRSQISAEFETQAGELAAARSRIEAQEGELKQAIRDTTALRRELEMAQARVMETDRQAGKASSERDQAREEAASLRGQLETARRDLERSESGRMTAEAKAQQTIHEANSSRRELELAQIKIVEIDRHIATVGGERDQSREEAAGLRRQLDSAARDLEQTQAKALEAERLATKASGERDQAREEAASLRGQFDTTRRDLEKSESGRIKAEAKAQQAVQDTTAAQNKVADALGAEKTAVAEAAKAREEAARLSGQLEATQAQNAALLERLRPPGPISPDPSSKPRGRRHSDDPPLGVTSQP